MFYMVFLDKKVCGGYFYIILGDGIYRKCYNQSFRPAIFDITFFTFRAICIKNISKLVLGFFQNMIQFSRFKQYFFVYTV